MLKIIIKQTMAFILIISIVSCQKEDTSSSEDKADQLKELKIKWAEANSGRWLSFAIYNADVHNPDKENISAVIYSNKKNYEREIMLLLGMNYESEVRNYLDSTYTLIYDEMDSKMNVAYMDNLFEQYKNKIKNNKSLYINKLSNTSPDIPVIRCSIPNNILSINSEELLNIHYNTGGVLLNSCQVGALLSHRQALRMYRDGISLRQQGCADLASQLKSAVIQFQSCPGGGDYGDLNPPGSSSGGGIDNGNGYDIVNNVQNRCLRRMVDSVISKDIAYRANHLLTPFRLGGRINLFFEDRSDLPSNLMGNASARNIEMTIDGKIAAIDVLVKLNANELPNASQEYIATIIVHEAIHAYLDTQGYTYVAEPQHEIMLISYLNALTGYLISHYNVPAPDAHSLAFEGLEKAFYENLDNVTRQKIITTLGNRLPPLNDRIRTREAYEFGHKGTKCN